MNTANAHATDAETIDPELVAAHAEGNPWFWNLPPDMQSDVVRHAALHIARTSQLFQSTEPGGECQEYSRLAVSIIRSGVEDAEAIFIEATAANTTTEKERRAYFKNNDLHQPSTAGVTVGSLFNTARQLDAKLDQWEHYSDIVHFVPGKEEQCRKQLDRVVAADKLTYTLGDPAGPLVILRVPDSETLPPEVQWKGDLPGTTLAQPADIIQRAERLRWMQRAGGKSENRLVRTGPPRPFVSDYLTQMRGRYGAPPLRGIARVPRIDNRGKIHFPCGYDRQTGLFHDRPTIFDVPLNPSRHDAQQAAEALLIPFSKYQFDDAAAGKALLLAAMFTAIERPFLTVAPMFVVRSSMPGTGKGLIVRSLVRLAFDTLPVIATWGGSSEEFEKRLGALLLQAPGAVSIDNANGMQVKGDLLEAILTEGSADIRPLGRSEMVKVRNRSFITLTGNNPIITGDMARRTLPIEILSPSADPERVRYGFNPADLIQRQRTLLLQAAFTAMRAFRLAGMPRKKLPAVGSFDDWSRRVRDLVYWLTGYDVSEGFRRNKAEDPRRQGDASLLAALHQHFGTAPFKAADAITVHKQVADHRRSPQSFPQPTPAEQALHDALDDVLATRDLNAKVFGYWARRVKGARTEGFMLETHLNSTTNTNDITVRRI